MRITLLVVILFLLSGVGVFAESQPPTLSKAEGSGQKQEDSRPINNTHHILKETPTPISFVSVPTGNPEPQVYKCQKEDNAPSEWCLIVLTALLAWATYRLVAETRRLVAETASASKRQAAETQNALNISQQSADAANKSADVAEKALTLIERPYVFVFGVGQFHLNPDSLEPSVAYEVANFGKTPAIIERAHIVLEDNKSNLNAPLEVDRRHSLVVAPILGAGEVRTNLIVDIPANMLSFKTINNIITPDMKHGDDLFFRAIIQYRSPFTKRHISSFCWRYNINTAHFEPYGHDDYNYTT